MRPWKLPGNFELDIALEENTENMDRGEVIDVVWKLSYATEVSSAG